MRGGDSLRRTGIDAARAASATVGQRGIGEEFQRGEYNREKKPGTQLRVDAHGALAMPRNATGCGPIALKHGTAINKAALPSADPFHHGSKSFQAGFDDFMVVIAPRVASDASGSGGGRRFLVEVICGENDNRAHLRHDASRILPFGGGALHPLHRGVAPIVQPLRERFRVRGGVRLGHATIRKSEREGGRVQIFFIHAADRKGVAGPHGLEP